MAKEMPFDEDAMTLIMGLEGPREPGQHGPTRAPAPSSDAVGLISQIRDMCEEWLDRAGKEEDGSDEGAGDDTPEEGEEEEM